MIKDILLPERLGNRFLFAQNHLGLEITKTSLIASNVHIANTQATITDFYQEAILRRDDEENDQAAINALQKLVEKTGTKTPVTIALPNQLAIFKELTIPFIEIDKIQQVLPLELEQQIPFAIADVAFDFIITKQDLETKKSTIFIGIVQKKDLNQIITLLENVHLHVDRITLDLFSVYNLYTQHPDYAMQTAGTALIDFGALNTSIAYINEKQLAAVRSLNYGLSTFTKNIAEKTQKTTTAVIDHLVRFGTTNIQDEAIAKAFAEELTELSNQIQFILATCTSQVAGAQPINNIILLTRNAIINGFEKSLGQTLAINTQYFNTTNLLGGAITLRSPLSAIPLSNVASLGAVIPWGAGQYFDLMRTYDQSKSEHLLFKQLMAGTILIAAFIATLAGYYYIQRTALRSQINKAKNAAVSLLRNELGITDRNLNAAVNNAKTKVDEFEAMWEGFSVKQRGLFLAYLNDLSTAIDRDGIGLNLKTLSLKKRRVILKGSVRGYPALKTFEEELGNLRLLRLINSPQEPDFEIKLAAVGQGETGS